MIITAIALVNDNDADMLTKLVKRTTHRVEIEAFASSAKRVGMLTMEHHPDVVFYDPEIDKGALLGKWRSLMGVYPLLVCVTSSAGYAMQAIEAKAVHYLTTKNRDKEVGEAIKRCAAQLIRYDRGDVNGNTARESTVPFPLQLVALPSATGIDMRQPHEFMSAHGEGAYTRVVLDKDPSVLISRPLGEIEPHLERAGLMRVHRSHMVSLDQIRHIRRGKSPVVQLSNGEEVDVSDSYREQLYSILQLRIHRKQDQA